MEKCKSRTYQEMASCIKEKLNGRPYKVGLDLGVGSIGIAVVALEPDKAGDLIPSDLIFASSRIFPSSEGASARRGKRGQRNAIRHKVNRLEKLWKILAEKELMLPYVKKEVPDPNRLRFAEEEIRKDVYSIRYKALTEQITLKEIGLALYHIAGHRGASSVRSFVESTEKEKKEAEKRRLTESICKKEHFNTFIEVLYYAKQTTGANFRNMDKYKINVPLPTRDIIENELNIILSNQQKYYPDVLTEDYVERIKECILFENEKIVPPAGNCPYFPAERKLPKAYFLNEERRIWEMLNNVRILDNSERLCLSKDEKSTLYSILRSGKDISQSQMKKVLPQYAKCREIRLQGSDGKNMKLTGFRFAELENSSWFSSLSEDKRLSFIEKYVNTPDDKKLKRILKEEFTFSDDEIDSALSINIPGGYAAVGLSAMKIIFEYIKKDGLSYQEAESRAIEEGKLKPANLNTVYDSLPYYGEVLSSSMQAIAGKAWHPAFEEKIGKKGFIKPFTNTDEELYGRIANPVVHQSLNELRKITNELIDILGKPYSVCIELGRELKVGKEKRDKISSDNNKRAKGNQDIYKKYCATNNLDKKYVKRFLLYEEQKHKCPYCLKAISDSDIVNGNADIDHIFPIDDTGDSSMNNLVLAHKNCNEKAKGKRIPYTAFSHDTENWKKIEQYVDEYIPQKAWRFYMTEAEYEEHLKDQSFAPRFKSDNAYVAKIACKYLQALYPLDMRLKRVRTIRSQETALLRRAWNLDGIIDGITSAYNEEREYDGKKNRDDNRHHAIDAIVAAYFTQKLSTIIETFSAQGRSLGEILKRIPIPKYYRHDSSLSKNEQRVDFRRDVENFVTYDTYVSMKQSVNKNGELVKDSRYTILASVGDNLVISKKSKVNDLKPKSLDGGNKSLKKILLDYTKPGLLDDGSARKIEKLLEVNRKKYEEISAGMDYAKEQLMKENEEKKKNGKKELPITEESILLRACKNVGGIYYQISNQKKFKLYVNKQGNTAFDTGSNYSLDFYYDEKGKLKAEIIRKINAVDKNYVPEYKKKGYVAVERIYPNDVLELDLIPCSGKSKKELSTSLITPNAPQEKTFVTVTTFTETGSGSVHVFYKPIVSNSENTKSSFYVTGLNKINVRKVVLSSLGLVVYRSRLLKDRGECVEIN